MLRTGPIPPDVTRRSYLADSLRAASMISPSSSAMVSMRLRSMPRSKQYLAKYEELVSTVCPGSGAGGALVSSCQLPNWKGERKSCISGQNLIADYEAGGGVDGTFE